MTDEAHAPAISRLYRFHVDRVLGRGGSGVVYRGVDKETKEVRALKLFHSTFFVNRAHIKEMERNVRSMSKLNHENVAHLYEFLSGDEGECLVLEYVDGPDLRWYVINRPWNLQERLVVTAQVCNGLQYIHERGLVHHDVKPSNILFTRKGQVKITDYSLARSRILAFFGASITELVTPMFVAPELIQKEKATPKSDQYALGVTMYFMFTGQYPFQVDSLQKIYQLHLKAKPDHPTLVNHRCPQALGDIIMRLLEKKPENRFSDCDQLRIALSSIGVSRI